MFSEARLRLISQRLGHNQVRDLLRKITDFINVRAKRDKGSAGTPAVNDGPPSTSCDISREDAAAYVKAYFEFVHPLYPFLDRDDFEARASVGDLAAVLQQQPAFSALYHTVLALGCQYVGDWSFDPGKGRVWQLFQVSVKLLPQLVAPPDTLANLQVRPLPNDCFSLANIG